MHAAWVSLSLVGAAAGVFALVGGRIVQFVLGNAYKGQVGRELGHLVVYLSPWMVAWVGFAVTFPLVFVAGQAEGARAARGARVRRVHPARARLARGVGPPGIAIAIGLATLVIALGLMARGLDARARGRRRRARAALARDRGGAALSPSAASRSRCSPIPAALLGVVVYALVIFSIRSFGLTDAWTYVRGLH